MSNIPLEFPIHVRGVERDGQRHYAVRPLLTGGPEGVARRFERAVQKCLEQVRDTFRMSHTSRADVDDLLWFRFNPELQTHRVEVSVKTGAGTLAGTVLAAAFSVGGHEAVVLPGFDYHLFVQTGRSHLIEEVHRVVEHLLREERKLKEPPNPKIHLADRSEFITTASTSVFVEGGPFPFESEETASFFASMFKDATEFRGVVELEATGRNLNRLYPETIERAFGVDDVVERVRHAMFVEQPGATVLVGPRGVGKTAIVHEATARMLESRLPHLDRAPHVWHLDPTRVIAGMRVVGAWQSRLEAILEYVRDRMARQVKAPGTDVLVVDNLVAMLRIGKSGQNSLTLADVIKPYLEKGEIPLIAEATPEVWKRVQEMDRGFADLFQVMRVPEPPREQAIRIVAKHRTILERKHGASLANEAVARLVDLQRAFPGRTAMPGCVVELLKELATKHRGASVGIGEVDAAFQGSSRLSALIFNPDLRLNERELREFVETRLIGQREAARCLVETVASIKARLARPEKPLGSFLFIGPTGVGKTEAAKVLAQFLFDDADALARFDMNEFIDDGAVGRLIGDAARPEGQLTNRVRHRPFSVLLFDEIEKAHETVHDLLLQVLGEGRLSDALGRTVDFANTVIIMTSNLGAGEAGRTVGFAKNEESQAAAYRKAVEDFFRPEFVNRIDRIVAFQPLGLDEIMRIARLQIERLLARDGFVRRSTCLNVRQGALEEIARRGFDPELGGRALKRAIERELTWMTAERLVQLPSNEPVIFEVHLRGGTLAPRIVPMPFVEERVAPVEMAPPEDRDLPAFFERLLDDANRIESALVASRTPGDPEYLLLKDRAYQLKKEVADVLHALPRDESAIPAFAFRWKGGKHPGCVARLEQFDPHDLFAQMDIRDYLEEKFRGAKREVSAARSMAMEAAAQVAALDLQHRAFAAGKRDGVCLHLRSCIEGTGAATVLRLAFAYQQLMKTVDSQFDTFDGLGPMKGEWVALADALGTDKTDPIVDGAVFLATSGPGLVELLRGEEGVHLFLEPYGRCVPVQVRVLGVPEHAKPAEFAESERAKRASWQREFDAGRAEGESDPWTPGRVVRIYAQPGGGHEGTITDLRTGLMEAYEATGIPWFIWALSATKGR